jgi:filamentous hemagglutinin
VRPAPRAPDGLRATLERICRGERHPHRRDGAVFANRERRLPERPFGYYHEWVHPTAGMRGPGPARVVTGAGGEVYYSPDHYQTFVRLDGEGP